MHKLLLSIAAGGAMLASAAAPVSAADLAVRSGPSRMFAPVPAFSWSGAYVGGNVGGIWGKHDFDPITATQIGGAAGACPSCAISATTDQGSALIGGFQTGYRWQTGSWVLGIEQDFQFTNLHNQVVLAADPAGAAAFRTGDAFDAKLKWLSSTRAQVGWAFDHWLVFATGGLATGVMDVTASWAARPGGSAAYSVTDDNKWHIGWTAGAGLEYAITDNISIGAEYRYIDLSSRTYNIGGPTFAAPASRAFQTTADVDFKSHEVLARLNIKTAPLMAMFGIH